MSTTNERPLDRAPDSTTVPPVGGMWQKSKAVSEAAAQVQTAIYAIRAGTYTRHYPTIELDALCEAVAACAAPSVAGAPVAPDAAVDSELGTWAEQVKEIVFYARVAARSKGYALAVHGTLRRDVDVVAIPWTEEACDPDELAESITAALHLYGVGYENAWNAAKATREEKPFGRLAWSIPVKWKFHAGAAPYLDLSVVPRALAPAPVVPAEPSTPTGAPTNER